MITDCNPYRKWKFQFSLLDCNKSIKALFYELGASPAIHELDMDVNGREMERALRSLGCKTSVPAVFIGGKFAGSSKDVISLHLDGSLKQMLTDARAIWL